MIRSGHRQADQPTGDEDRLATEPVGERARGEVRDRLGEPEGDDERERRDEPGEPEDVGRQERQDRPLLADHPADERVHADQQRELAGVGAGARAGRRSASRRRLPARRSFTRLRRRARQEIRAQPTLALDLDLAPRLEP